MGDKTKEKKKLTKLQLRTVIVSAVSAAVAIALIITNFFVPVKYLSSYMVIRNKGAKEGVMRVRFVDVGYGDCTIIELPDGKNMLIDAGNGRGPNQSRILSYLNKCNINTIDYLVCTSVNSEHCGGLAEIMRLKTVKTVYQPFCSNNYITDEYLSFKTVLKPYDAVKKVIQFGAGEENAESGYFFKFLSPSVYDNPNGEYEELKKNPASETARNNASAVMWLQYGETCFLFTSDAGGEVLKGIYDSYAVSESDYPVKIENCNIVQVANHGGAGSACAEFYDLLNADKAIISVGENAEDSPSLQVISDLKDTEIYRTDERKTVTVEVTEDGFAVV